MSATDSPAVSVVVAALDAARTLPVLFESLAASGLRDWELCLCDDGSADGTRSLAAAFAARAGRPLRLAAHARSLGPAAARNAAAALARAPLLLFLDADVRLEPDTPERLLASLSATGADAVCGVYAPRSLDPDIFSRYYAALVHHSSKLSDRPIPYNVFNAWCALCRREAWERVGGHPPVRKGVEIENETLGRRFAAAGLDLRLDPSIAVEHHWGGGRKLFFIFTRRVYWWVKTYFSCGRRFELYLTTPTYSLATLCAPATALTAAAAAFGLLPWPAVLLPAAGYTAGYGPFLLYTLRMGGPGFLLAAAALNIFFSTVAAASAAYSAAEELAHRLRTGRWTVDPELYGA